MKPEPVLIDLTKLRDLISKLDLDARRKEYIDARWLNYIEWWDSRANRAKWRYHALRTTVVFGGAQHAVVRNPQAELQLERTSAFVRFAFSWR